MKVNFYKQPGGILQPATDLEYDKMCKFKTGEIHEVEIKLHRNPAFHRKVFVFFNYLFKYWKSDHEFMDEAGQFEVFRKNLTVLAGYYEKYYTITGEVRVEAKSLAYANMSQEEFEACYQALIQAAIKHIYGKLQDEELYNELVRFF